ncbi:hypothetical protein MASR1M59_26790 [Melaminivora sp.]
MGHDFVLGQQVAYQLAQRQITLGRAVAAQVGIFGRQGAQAAAHAFGKQPFARQPATAGLVAQRAVFKNALHVPHGIKVVVRHGLWLAVRGIGPAAHIKARVRARHRIPLRHQPVVGVHHGVHADAMGMGKLPDRGQLGAGTQAAILYQLPKTLDNLEHQGRGRCVFK